MGRPQYATRETASCHAGVHIILTIPIASDSGDFEST